MRKIIAYTTVIVLLFLVLNRVIVPERSPHWALVIGARIFVVLAGGTVLWYVGRSRKADRHKQRF